MAGLDGDEVEAEFVGKWGVSWGTAKGWTGVRVEGRTRVLFGPVGKVVV
jgi:hypothetical protein